MQKPTIKLIQVNRKDLLDRLKFHTGCVIEKRNTIPILSNVRLHVDGGRLCITSTDLDMMLFDSVPAQYMDDGASVFDVTVPGDWLAKSLGAMDGITVEMSIDGGKLVVTDQEITIRPAILDSEDYPYILGKVDTLVATARFPVDQLRGDLERVRIAMSTEETRYYLNGIFLHVVDDGYLAMAATNGHMLVALERPGDCFDARLTEHPEVIIPRKAVGIMIKMLEKAEGTVELRFYAGNALTRVDMVIGDRRLMTKTVDGTFPDYMRVVPTERDNTLEADQKQFAAKLKKALVLAAAAKGWKHTIGIEDGAFSVQSHETGGAKVKVAYATAGDFPSPIAFNGNYLNALVGILDGRVTMSMKDANTPALLTCDGSPELACVLMPFRP